MSRTSGDGYFFSFDPFPPAVGAPISPAVRASLPPAVSPSLLSLSGSAIMAPSANLEEVPLKIVVDREKNRVLFAEAGKDFVDVLLSFLTLPLGTIARLLKKDSKVSGCRFGCISTLYESVTRLDPKFFSTETCKDMLMHPRNAMKAYCNNLKLNIDDTEPTKYYLCDYHECNRQLNGVLLSTFRNKKCHCGRKMTRMVIPDESVARGKINEGFVREIITFIIADDLFVMPADMDSVFMSIGSASDVVEMDVNVSHQKVLDLLQLSFDSKTPLTDLFLGKKQAVDISQSKRVFSLESCNEPVDKSRRLEMKLMLSKSNNKIFFAQVEEDFVDLLFSFLTFPLGAVQHVLGGFSCSVAMDYFYISLTLLDGGRYFIKEELRNMLIKPRIAPQCELDNQILPIDALCPPQYSCYADLYGKCSLTAPQIGTRNLVGEVYSSPLTLLDPKSSSSSTSRGRFVKESVTFMVTDELVVTPFSSSYPVSLLNNLEVPASDLEVMEIDVGVKEVLGILKASMVSSSALTYGLGPFIENLKPSVI